MKSPCLEVCILDGRTGWCRACGRTKDEWAGRPGRLRGLGPSYTVAVHPACGK
jgi:hypothetical protein